MYCGWENQNKQIPGEKFQQGPGQKTSFPDQCCLCVFEGN